jgi:hypothetical protein
MTQFIVIFRTIIASSVLLLYPRHCYIQNNTSTDLDEIPARFIKDGANVIKVPITSIINQSITTGVVPQSMKYARVKPLLKKNSPLEVGNTYNIILQTCSILIDISLT